MISLNRSRQTVAVKPRSHHTDFAGNALRCKQLQLQSLGWALTEAAASQIVVRMQHALMSEWNVAVSLSSVILRWTFKWDVCPIFVAMLMPMALEVSRG